MHGDVCSCDALGVALSVSVQDEWLHSTDVPCGVYVFLDTSSFLTKSSPQKLN